jgi:aryl-alcohol dehydrogenase-like predicted oxidoreductase
LVPSGASAGIGIVARCPFDEGALTGKFTAETKFPEGDFRRIYFGAENLAATVQRVEAVRGALPAGLALPEAALRFAISHPAVHTVIPGMRRPAHVRANVGAVARGVLPDAVRSLLRPHRWDRQPAAWSL